MVVALLGHGTVGGGVYELLKNRSDITVKYVLDRSPIAELGAVSVTDFSTILNDGEVDTVVEMEDHMEPEPEAVSRKAMFILFYPPKKSLTNIIENYRSFCK